jgi:serine phosphatase RsbU (regulator of sigma subunit)
VVDPDHRDAGPSLGPSALSQVLPAAGLEVEGRYQAADLDVRAGGDFFDVFPLGPDRTAVIIGDVAGHGSAAAAAGRCVRALVRGELGRAARPSDVLLGVEAALVREHVVPMVTLLCAEIDTANDVVTMASAGHCWPVVRRGSGIVERLEQAPAPPVGVGLLSASSPPAESTLPFLVGDLLVLFTDGLVERRRIPLDAVLGWVQQAVAEQADPERLCRRLFAVAQEARDHDDDIAVLIVRRSSPGAIGDRVQAIEERV